jgi:hypothetical protein
MNRQFLKLSIPLALVLLIAACGSTGSTTDQQVVVERADDVQRIAPATAMELLNSGEAVLIDARSAAAFEAAHASGAISLPAAEAAARFDELPRGKSLVFY